MTLEDIQARLVALVQTCELLTGRPVLAEAKDNLVNQIEVALQTQSLAVTIAAESGQTRDGAPPGREAWEEQFEIVVHRGLVDAGNVPSTAAVIDALRDLIKGASSDPTKAGGLKFRCKRHELRDAGDGTYCRVLTVGLSNPVS